MADLIRKGFNKDPSLRPGPEELLQHHAFQILGMFLVAIRQGGGGGHIVFVLFIQHKSMCAQPLLYS